MVKDFYPEEGKKAHRNSNKQTNKRPPDMSTELGVWLSRRVLAYLVHGPRLNPSTINVTRKEKKMSPRFEGHLPKNINDD